MDGPRSVIRSFAGLLRLRRKHRTLQVADDEAFSELLAETGLLQLLQAGDAACAYCGDQLSQETVQGIASVNGEPALFCGRLACIRMAASASEAEVTTAQETWSED